MLLGPMITVSPYLAKRLGLDTAVVLQEMVFRLDYGEKREDGNKWMLRTQDELLEWFPFLTSSVLRRILKQLAEEGVLLQENAGRHGTWYAVSEKRFDEIDAEASALRPPRKNVWVSFDKEVE